MELDGLRGFAKLQAKILDLAAASPSLRAEWPATWLPVRDEVRAVRKKQPHMTPATFRTLMRKKGVTDRVAQDDLAKQLHNLGEILYFQEREELAGLVILSPEWVTELIALVVRSEGARANHGMLSKAELEKLWKKAKLPPNVQRYLIRLMDWFDLTYSTEHRTDIGMVVEALPYSKPEDLLPIWLPEDQPSMEMIYRFPEIQKRLPPGIPTWGIARAHRYSKCQPWRDAAAFQDEGTKSHALIVASETAKEIRLRVAGDYPPFFFGVLQGILLDTFKRYPGVAPERRLPCPCKRLCDGTYLYETVLKRKRDGKQSVTCDRSGDDVAIGLLLEGFRPPKTDEGLHAMHSEMRRLFTEQRRGQNERVEKICPSVFTLIPSSGFHLVDTWMESATREEELELSLYCEHDSGWHTTSSSVYRFRPDQEWFDLLKKWWGNCLAVTKYVVPLAKVVGVVVPGAEVAGFVEKLPAPHRWPEGKLAGPLGIRESPFVVEYETRYFLEGLIEHLDSLRSTNEPKKGGLYPYQIEDGRLLWMCPEHVKAYSRR